MTERICGVDVSSLWLDAQVGQSGPFQRFNNTAEGHAALIAFCHEHEAGLVAMEATGGYERPLLASLAQAGMTAALLNPRQVRRFAEAMGRLEKTDRIDAGIIAHFAEVRKARPAVPPSAAQSELRALATRLRQLTRKRVAEQNQIKLVEYPKMRSMSEQLIAFLDGQIDELVADIGRLLESDPVWSALERACRTIKGVGDRTVAMLMAELPELGTITGKQAGKLAGLAPMARDSGRHKGKRPIRGGRASLRGALYLASWNVARYQPGFMEFHERMKAKNKPSRVLYVAVARKLLVQLNAKARDARMQLAALQPA